MAAGKHRAGYFAATGGHMAGSGNLLPTAELVLALTITKMSTARSD